MATTLALPACVLGTVDEPTTEEASTATLAAALDIGDAFCSWYYACDCNPGLGPHRDEQECRLFVSTEFTRRLEQGSNADLEQDDRCYDDIVAYFESAQCADANDVAFDAQLRGALDLMLACKPWSGGAIEGQSCTPLPTAKGDDCAPGLACDLDFEVCVPSVLIPEGDACGAMSPPCEPGLTCASTNDDDERCMRLPLLGDPCDGDECSAGLWCPPDSQTCAELPAAGASCPPRPRPAPRTTPQRARPATAPSSTSAHPTTRPSAPKTSATSSISCS